MGGQNRANTVVDRIPITSASTHHFLIPMGFLWSMNIPPASENNEKSGNALANHTEELLTKREPRKMNAAEVYRLSFARSSAAGIASFKSAAIKLNEFYDFVSMVESATQSCHSRVDNKWDSSCFFWYLSSGYCYSISPKLCVFSRWNPSSRSPLKTRVI